MVSITLIAGHMNIKDFKYLVALADYGHFGKAADNCCVSQPALSMQIKKMEEYLGVKLLERTNKSVLLTDHGSLIAERARHIINQVEEVRDIAKSAKDLYSGEFKVGIFPTLAPYLLPKIISELSEAYPKLSLYLIEEKTDALIEKLEQGKLHAAILAFPVVDKNFSNLLLFEEEFLLAVPANHPLAKLTTIKQQDFEDQNIMLLEEGHCMRDQSLQLCDRMKAREMKDFRATSLETLRHMIIAGIGITLMPKLACQPNDHLAYIPFDQHQPVRTIGLYWRAATTKKPLFEAIAIKIRSILATQNWVKVID